MLTTNTKKTHIHDVPHFSNWRCNVLHLIFCFGEVGKHTPDPWMLKFPWAGGLLNFHGVYPIYSGIRVCYEDTVVFIAPCPTVSISTTSMKQSRDTFSIKIFLQTKLWVFQQVLAKQQEKKRAFSTSKAGLKDLC